MKSPVVALVLVLACASSSAGVVHAAGAPRQIPVVRLEVERDVTAPATAVWAQLTLGKNLVTWCPVWKSTANAARRLARVGDVLDYTDAWGHGGRSVVTFLDVNRELRVAHEPNDGSYLCQARVTLTPAAGGTHVRYVEQYTDESSPKDLEATAAKTTSEMNAALTALKQGAERH
jgi:uncharacterized protein YndB with AHSA1/START domain